MKHEITSKKLQLADIRITERCTGIFVQFNVQAEPSVLVAVLSALGQIFLIWAAESSGVFADYYLALESLHQMSIFMVYEDHLRTRMFEYIADLALR